MSNSQEAGVIIIGAGIIGASCAFRLSEQGLKVVILTEFHDKTLPIGLMTE
jgi:glycine/D-amino acid oxidase-like deaminating enzyme